MKRSLIGVAATSMLLISACGGSDSGSSSSEAQQFCDQLNAGTAPFDVFQSMRDAYPNQPDWAVAAKGWAQTSCPDQLKTNEQLRNIISNTGGDPDS